MQSQKQQNDLSLFPKQAIQHHSNTSLCPNPQVVLAVKNPLANVGEAGYAGSIPGWIRSPREENECPLQYSCLVNSMDRGAWWATVHGVAKSWTQLSTDTHTHTCLSWGQRSWSWPVLWRTTRPSRTYTKKRCPFHQRGSECKNRKLRDTEIRGKFGLGV